MSHQPERPEKNCLNCKTIVAGRFCQVCGQENIVTKESFWSLCKHFVYDILHFDGKFFDTLKYLFTRPGYVARQYVDGRRASFLHPIRMYLFTSAIFFLVFFAINSSDRVTRIDPLDPDERNEAISEYNQVLKKNPGDTAAQRKLGLLRDTSRPVYWAELGTTEPGFNLGSSGRYESIAEYDSVQAALPSSEREGWFSRKLTRKGLSIREKYKYNVSEGVTDLGNVFLHMLPYMLFISLPFFALILKLLYVRRKDHYYSDHAVFTLFHYIFSFLLLLVGIGISRLKDATGWAIFNWIVAALFIFWLVCFYKEMLNFYKQKRWKTFGKFILVNILGLVLLLALFMLFFFISILQM